MMSDSAAAKPFDMSKTFLIIPCYNEEECIVSTLKDVRNTLPDVRIVVVNDGSTDHTLQCLEAQNDPLLTVLDLPCNSGIGTAVKAGLLYAKRNGAEYAVKFDADGQHLAEEISLLLAPVMDGKADVAIGSRFVGDHKGFKSTFFRRIGIRFFTFWSYLLVRQAITDSTSGFRAYGREALVFSARDYPAFDYPEPEECIQLIRNGFRVSEVACKMAVRQGGISSIHPLKSLYYMIKVAFSMCMEAIRPVKRRS